MWRRAIHPEQVLARAPAEGVFFVHSLTSQLTQAQDLAIKKYPLLSISHNRDGSVSQYFRPHRLWVDGRYSESGSEVHFSAAHKEMQDGSQKDVVYFQTAPMKRNGHAYLLVIHSDIDDKPRTHFLEVNIVPDGEILYFGQVKVSEAKNGQLNSCLGLMHAITSHKNVIDAPAHFEVYNTPTDVLELAHMVESTLANKKDTVPLNGLFH